MNIPTAQHDMRNSYLGGSAGVFASSIVWLIAGILALYHSQETSIIAFFFGGMMIHPLGILTSKLLGRSGKHNSGNPMATLALESTVLIFIGLFIAYALLRQSIEWFYPIMLLTIGARYLIFQTIYGMKIFWVLGLILIAGGSFSLITNSSFYLPAIGGGVIELIIAVIIFLVEKKKSI